MKTGGIRFALALGVLLGGSLASSAQDVLAHDMGEPPGPVSADVVTIYRETFGYCTGSLGAPAAQEARWAAFISGLPVAKFSNLKVFSYGSSSIGGSVRSNPIGLSEGYSFWFRPTYGLTIFTDEFSFDAAVLRDPTTLIQYEQRLSGINAALELNKTQIAVLIDSTWYISEQSVAQRSVTKWESVSVSPALLTWGAVPAVGNVGPVIPTSFNSALPASGVVRAFGVFVTEVNGRVRIENYTIRTANPSGGAGAYEVQMPTVASCPLTSPDQGGVVTPGPTPTPNADEGDGSPDQGQPELPPVFDTPTPGEPTPGPDGPSNPTLTPTPNPYDTTNPRSTPTPTPDGQSPVTNPLFSFCPQKEQGAGRSLALSKKMFAGLMKPIGTLTARDLRDRAFFALFVGRKLPMGAIVNVQRSDYDAAAGTLAVKVRKNAAARTIRLKASARAAFDAYIGALSTKTGTAPLFARDKSGTSELDAASAMCLKDVQAAVKSRARRAKVPLLSFVKRR